MLRAALVACAIVLATPSTATAQVVAVELSAEVAAPGQQIEVLSDGWAADGDVAVALLPGEVELAIVTADGDGDLAGTVAVPEVGAGEYEVVLRGTESTGGDIEVGADLEVVDVAPEPTPPPAAPAQTFDDPSDFEDTGSDDSLGPEGEEAAAQRPAPDPPAEAIDDAVDDLADDVAEGLVEVPPEAPATEPKPTPTQEPTAVPTPTEAPEREPAAEPDPTPTPTAEPSATSEPTESPATGTPATETAADIVDDGSDGGTGLLGIVVASAVAALAVGAGVTALRRLRSRRVG